jgi:outer membrane biosynthesis protein TonB
LSRSQNEARDPPFLEDLRKKIKRGELPLPSPEKVLYRKRTRIFDREGMTYSFIIHASLAVIILIKTFFPDLFLSRDEIQARLRMRETKTAIRVDMVGLPTLTRQEIEKLDLTQEATKPPGTEKGQDTEAVEVAPPSKDVMKLPDAEGLKKPGENTVVKNREDKLKAAKDTLKKELSAEARRKALMQKLGSGNSEGRASVEGNIISKGYAASGTVATEMEAYQGQLRGHIRRFWDVPSWMNATSLKARILVRLSFDGHIVSKEFLVKSGNNEFDRYVDQTISAAEPFPAPPELLKRSMLEEGVEWGFPQ